MLSGETATQLVDLILSECEPLDELGKRIVANRIAEAIHEWRGWEKPKEGPLLVPMTEAEAISFERLGVPFGEYQYQPWAHVPLERLAWYADTARENWRQLWRYLHSDRVKRERSDEG